MSIAKNPRICKKGHKYYKSSDCPVCPICEKDRKPSSGFLSLVPAPARRALEREGITSLKLLAKRSEVEISALHGMGPKAIGILKASLKNEGLSFSKH